LSGTINYFDDPLSNRTTRPAAPVFCLASAAMPTFTAWLAGVNETQFLYTDPAERSPPRFNRYRQDEAATGRHHRLHRPEQHPGRVIPFPRRISGAFPPPTVRGYSTLGLNGNLPQDLVTNKYQIIDNVVWIRGNHTTKFGFDVRRSQGNNLSAQNGRAAFVFQRHRHHAHQRLLRCRYAARLRHQQLAKSVRTQDLSTHLRLQRLCSGRLENSAHAYSEPRHPLRTQHAVHRSPQSAFELRSGERTGYVAGQNGGPSNVYHYDRNNFQPPCRPRLEGFAQLVVRAGFGIYGNSATTYNGVGSIYFNPPFRNRRLSTPRLLFR